MAQRVLLVEDDERLGEQVVASLRSAGLEPVWVRTGDDALLHDFGDYALVILDLMLPGAHGFDVLKALRAGHRDVPVLVVSARQDTHDKIRGFELGADDYLTKPFWPEELKARVQARLRRPAVGSATTSVEIGGLRIDVRARIVTVDSQDVEVTRAEFEILAALARRPGAAVSRASLVEAALDPDAESDDRALDVHISRIRRKLGASGASVATVWGIGYRLKVNQ
jgi:DNA-binding response OmpR family regulator